VTYSPTDGAATALVEVTMPQMGVSVAEGTILEWRKRPGDRVERDETICEISTDKIDTEIPSPVSGRLVRILVEPNETVAVGTVLAQIETSTPEREIAASRESGEPQPQGNGSGPDRSRVISPVVQRIAAEHGIDLSRVKGSGIGGRIRKKDVMEMKAARRQADGRVLGGTSAAEEPRPLHTESPYRPEPEPVAEGSREPLSAMRRQIAEHMVRSRRTAAHCTTVIEVDMSRVAASRDERKPAFAERGVPLTYLAFVARASVVALQEQPLLNASIDGDDLVRHADVNLGIAVALEGGLIVPVIKQAQRLSLEGMAGAIADLSERARSKRLTAQDVQGGTFTITNPGQYGTVIATPIIHQPQVAILDLEAVVKRPVVVEGSDGDAVGIRPTTNLCLSFDHRALDGADAARFLGRIKARLEGWIE
jgi:pyruvate/2-oxoglutarate dehydrogenase complex dihydrolipoamide acyltransferase (E2) component